MRKILLPLILSILLSSCAVYTIGQGKANIHFPEPTQGPETRYRIIKEMEAEEKGPWSYNPVSEVKVLETEKQPLHLLFIPLENNAELDKIASSIRALQADFIFVTGQKEQLEDFAAIIGRNAVITEGGMIIYETELKAMDNDSAVFQLNEKKSIEAVILTTFEGLPDSSAELGNYLPYMQDKSGELDKVSVNENSVIFALSSYEPSSEDWIPFTYYPYREEHVFKTSEWFKENSYLDVYRTTHYSAETEPGITRENGDIFERMDFIYVKDILPLNSTVFSVAGMTNRAIYAEVLIP